MLFSQAREPPLTPPPTPSVANLSSYSLAAIVVFVHILFRSIFSARASRLRELSDNETFVPVTTRDQPWDKRKRKTVCVTGGAGFLGSAVVRRLAENSDVIVLDRRQPKERVLGVNYIVVNDLALADLTDFFARADVVAHVAGLVFLRDDAALLHNAHVVVTRNVVRCARRAGVQALCFTSSGGAITSPYVRTSQLRVPCDLEVDTATFPFASHYSRCKYAAERDVLASNEDGFATLALRLPGLYGLGDVLIVDPLLDGRLSHVPSRMGADGCPIDFCYVENAAHAHAVAIDALLARPASVGGRTFNITDGEAETRPVVAMWNELLTVCKPGAPKLRPLPYPAAYALACLTEAIDWYTSGQVPWPSHALWGLTRSSLGFATTPISLALSADLGYVPRFTAAQSFADIKRRWEAGVEPKKAL